MNFLMAYVTRRCPRVFYYWVLAFCFAGLLGCGDASDNPHVSVSPVKKFDFAGALQQLKEIDDAINAANIEKAKSLMAAFKASIPMSFPLPIETPFSTHSFHDGLMKISKGLANSGQTDLVGDWDDILSNLDDKTLINNQKTIALNMKISRSVLNGKNPSLTTTLHEDFTALSKVDLDLRESITQESFWKKAFLYEGDKGKGAELDTGIVTVHHDGELVAILEFKNHLVTKKPIDLSKQRDLIEAVAASPGYVSSVGRRAAYARFDLGRKMFEKFFIYARAHRIEESFLHVRADNKSAINLYEKLGYKEVARIPNYYSQPSQNAIVMQKKF